MSRTIRRTYKHLFRWFLPSLEQPVTQSRDPWRQLILPGQWNCKERSNTVRCIQSDKHRFFQGIGRHSRNRVHRLHRQTIRREMLKHLRNDTWDSWTDHDISIPYM